MDNATKSPESSSGVPKWVKITVLGLIAAVVLFFGAIFFYTEVIKDSPDKLTTADLDAALAVDTTVASATDDPPVPAATTVEATISAGTTPAGTAAADATVTTAATETPATGTPGTWVATADSTVGYRIKEVLFGIDAEGVGRTNVVDGTLTIDGTTLATTDFTVDMATITSDDSRRDGQFRGRIMSVDEFPTATFTLTAPVELGTEPVEGAEVAVSATGDLTLRGVTQTVTFDLTAKLENGRIGVLGDIPVVFADYGIANPSTSGITTEDHGLLEFVLVFEPG
ncbi:MAG TPA: YceI family protein [Ilumatobacter sp.]|nr:YceI family protein [Ilumatobacter sp.]